MQIGYKTELPVFLLNYWNRFVAAVAAAAAEHNVLQAAGYFVILTPCIKVDLCKNESLTGCPAVTLTAVFLQRLKFQLRNLVSELIKTTLPIHVSKRSIQN